ncbi:hypothetical protein CBER1_08336 [Cercospora berteroae]|uniref:Uncharacterized protein n=1 Tax=Cercospora berteroae TaxID=357750 RepID=A0A2S6CFG4_9PEZI|nr:hypothetical protein CBER1_08336 [Cercospora berteroae]
MLAQSNLIWLTEASRDLNNALQHIAKILELWFGVVAGAFMYNMVMGVAQSRHGSPVRLLTLPVGFSNLINSFDFDLWASSRATKSRSSRLVWTVVLLVSVLMGILVNLMGPATATLVLPSLKWVKTSPIPQGWFHSIDTSFRPGEGVKGNGTLVLSDLGCSAEDLASGRYSCATKWSSTRDTWVATAIDAFTTWGVWKTNGSFSGITNSGQHGMTLYLNETWSDRGTPTTWIPSRQILNQLSFDQDAVVNMSLGFDATQIGIEESLFQQYAAFNDTLGTRLRRNGTILGTLPSIWRGRPWTTRIDENRGVMCFPHCPPKTEHYWTGTIDDSLYTKCIQVGDGWAESYPGSKHRSKQFSIDADNETFPAVLVDVFSSSKAVFHHPEVPALNASTPEDRARILPASCFNETVPVGIFCNWTHFFGSHSTSGANESSYDNTLVFSRNDSDTKTSLAVSYVAKLGYTTYELDPWPGTNPLNLVQTHDLPYNRSYSPIPIDPSWTLAAWGVDWDNGHVLHNRSIARQWHSLFDHPGFENEDPWKQDYNDTTFGNTVLALLTIPVIQTLSLAGWSTGDVRHDGSMKLTLEAHIYVWAYGFDSKTAKLGGAVAITGCVIACLQFVGGFLQRRRRRTLSQVLVAALAHRSKGTTDAQQQSRFHVTDAEDKAGGLRFARWSAR